MALMVEFDDPEAETSLFVVHPAMIILVIMAGNRIDFVMSDKSLGGYGQNITS